MEEEFDDELETPEEELAGEIENLILEYGIEAVYDEIIRQYQKIN